MDECLGMNACERVVIDEWLKIWKCTVTMDEKEITDGS